MTSTEIWSGTIGIAASLWIGLVGMFCVQTMRFIPWKKRNAGRKIVEGAICAVFFIGGFLTTQILGEFLHRRSTDLFSFTSYAGYAIGALIGFYIAKESYWAIRYYDRKCGDTTVPSDVRTQ